MFVLLLLLSSNPIYDNVGITGNDDLWWDEDNAALSDEDQKGGFHESLFRFVVIELTECAVYVWTISVVWNKRRKKIN